MPAIAYTVRATIPNESLAHEYVAWLVDDHVAKVIRAGAMTAQVVRQTDPALPIQIEVRYVFADRKALDDYLRESAPGLRAEGLTRFPADLGITLVRTVGEIVMTMAP